MQELLEKQQAAAVAAAGSPGGSGSSPVLRPSTPLIELAGETAVAVPPRLL